MSETFRGTSIDQDVRWANKDKKLKKQMDFPKIFARKIDFKRVQKSVIHDWIQERLVQLMDGYEDEVVVHTVINQLNMHDKCDPRDIQLQLTAFLGAEKARAFCREMWKLLVSAMKTEGGIPSEFLEKERQMAEQQQIEQRKVEEQIRKKREMAMQAKQDIEKRMQKERSSQEQQQRQQQENHRSHRHERERDRRERSERYESAWDRRDRASSPRSHHHYRHSGGSDRHNSSGRSGDRRRRRYSAYHDDERNGDDHALDRNDKRRRHSRRSPEYREMSDQAIQIEQDRRRSPSPSRRNNDEDGYISEDGENHSLPPQW